MTNLSLGRVHPEVRRIHVTGKGRKERHQHLGNAATEALRRYLEARRALDPNTDALWVDDKGRPMASSWLYFMSKRLGGRIGVDLHPHMFRHTFVIDLIRAGVPLPVIEVMGGWERIPPTYLRTLGDIVAQEFQGSSPPPTSSPAASASLGSAGCPPSPRKPGA